LNSGFATVVAIITVVAIVTVVTFAHALDISVRLAQTSDSAQGFVAAHAVARGNILLSGWHFPLDDYYFTDTIPYAVLEMLVGPRPFLLTLVPALTYALFVFAVLIACLRPPWASLQSFAAVSVVALILAAPAWTGSWNPLLLSDMHVATVLGAFVAIALCAGLAAGEGRSVLACIALPLIAALTVASDPFALVFAFGPALIVLAAEVLSRPDAAGVRLATALLAGGILGGVAIPVAIACARGFTIENDVATAFIAAQLFGRNLAAVLSGILTLFGVADFGPIGFRALILLVLRCAALASVVVALARVIRRPFGRETSVFDRLLCAGILTDLVACALSAQFAKGITSQNLWIGGPPMRFLVPAYLFGAVLAGRHIPGALSALRVDRVRSGAITLLGMFAAVAVFVGGWLSEIASLPRWIDDNPPTAAARWLRAHDLTQGVGEYWSANLVTAMSGDAVQVRSVVPADGKLIPYIWVEDGRWYARAPQFVIWEDHNKTGMSSGEVRVSYAVCRVEFVAGYRIAVLAQASGPGGCES
jgi:hypothetical protein